MKIDFNKPAQEIAEQIMKAHEPYVYCYSGSGMLTNTESPEVIKMMSASCAFITIELLLEVCPTRNTPIKGFNTVKHFRFMREKLEEAKEIVNKLKLK